MHSLSFPRFVRELKDHPAPGYHTIYGQVDRLTATAWFGQRLVCCPQPYLDFLNDIGSGSFFAGSLVLFSIESPGSLIDITTNRLPEDERARFVVIGYDGTTEGCYCLRRGALTKPFTGTIGAQRVPALTVQTLLNGLKAVPKNCLAKQSTLDTRR